MWRGAGKGDDECMCAAESLTTYMLTCSFSEEVVDYKHSCANINISVPIQKSHTSNSKTAF